MLCASQRPLNKDADDSGVMLFKSHLLASVLKQMHIGNQGFLFPMLDFHEM